MLAFVWWLSFLRRDGRLSRQVTPNAGQRRADRWPGFCAALACGAVGRDDLPYASLRHPFSCAPILYSRRALRADRNVTYVLIVTIIGSSFTQIGFALWSDYRALKIGHAARARVPFILAGTLLCGAIGVLPFVGRGAFGPIYWVLAIGMSAYPLAFTLGFDIVPRAFAGRFFGLTSAISVAVNAAIVLVAGVISGATHSPRVISGWPVSPR